MLSLIFTVQHQTSSLEVVVLIISSLSTFSSSISDFPQISQFFFVELEVARLFFALSAASSSSIDEPLKIWFFCL